ncbi:MAG: amidohydrolase family protein [Burkholderiaceae bacterium]
MSEQASTYHPAPRKPKFLMPAGACDAHCHVFGPTDRFPYAADARFRPPEADKETLFALHDRLGIRRCVIVQSGCHGYDNSAVADAIQARAGRYLGIGLCPAEVDDNTLDRLHDQGFRGLRFNYMAHLAGGPTDKVLSRLGKRLVRLGWHLQIHLESSLLASMAPSLAAMPVPVVIDHMARIEVGETGAEQAFDELLRLHEQPNIWVKVSALERASRRDPPWHDALPVARALVAACPTRVLWGTDWPHPNFRAAPPDDGEIVDLIPLFAPTPELRQALLVDNPQAFYQFDELE